MTTIKQIIEAAFNRSPARMLSLREFLQFTKPINDEFADRYFSNLRSDVKIYISDDDIRYMGYKGEIRLQKQQFIKTIKNTLDADNYHIFSNDEYKNYYVETEKNINSILCKFQNLQDDENKNQLSTDIVLQDPNESEALTLSDYRYPNPNNYIGIHGKGQQKHIIMTVRGFKEVLMMINTEKAKMVRKYYIDLEEIMKMYDMYNMHFMRHCISKLDALLIETKAARAEASMKTDLVLLELQAAREENNKIITKLDETSEEFNEYRDDAEVQNSIVINKLDIVNSKLNQSVVDRVVQPAHIKQECFIIFRTNEGPFSHKVIRAKNESIKKSIDALKVLYTEAVEIYRVVAAPNAKTLYQNIREGLSRLTYKGNYINLPDGYSEEKFIKRVNRIYESRKDV